MIKKIKEASTTLSAKGAYGGDFKVLTNKNKKTKKTPWYMKTVSEIESVVVEGLALIKEDKAYDEYIADLTRDFETAKKDLATDRKNYNFISRAKGLISQITRAKRAYKKDPENWRDYMIDPSGDFTKFQKPDPEKQPEGLDQERIGDLLDQASSLQSSENIAPEIKKSIRSILHRAAKSKPGVTPSSDMENMRKWIDMIYKKHDGKLIGYGEDRSKNLKTSKKFKPRPSMAVKGGHKVSSQLAKSTHVAKGPEARSLRVLTKKLSAEDPGSDIAKSKKANAHTLQQVYKKLADEYIFGKGGNFDAIVDKLQDKYYGVQDLHKTLAKYTQMSKDVPPEDVDNLRSHFTGDEWSAIEELSSLTDTDRLSKIDPKDLTEFERAIIGPVRAAMGADKDDSSEKIKHFMSRLKDVDAASPKKEPTEEESEEEAEKVDRSLARAEKIVKPQHSPTRTEEPDKAKRREFQRSVNEPRSYSPEELEARREIGARAREIALSKKYRKQQRKDLIKQSHKDYLKQQEKQKMAANESTNLMKVLEGLLGDDDPNPSEDYDEKVWEKAKLARKKDFEKDLSLLTIGRKRK